MLFWSKILFRTPKEWIMRKLLIASQNQGKLKEIQALLNDLEIDLILPKQIGLNLEIKEDGQTYAENASLKAKAFAEASGVMTLADDTGLEVDTLDGQPGLYSARFAPQPGATDADRRGYLLQKLASRPRPWTARFRCVVVLYTPDGVSHFAEGICPGEIIPEERGQHGFGYDPIFQVQSMERTMAELELEEKNRLSHRALAILAIRPKLIEIINS
jgi:XTP/dITP diphosphohydrolase